MSSDSSSPALPSEIDVLDVSPPTGLAACIASPTSLRSPALPLQEVENDPSHIPLTASISKVLLDIDALPPPPSSSGIVITEPLAGASPLTARTLRSQRRDALRATRDVAVASPPDTALLLSLTRRWPAPLR